MINRHSYLLAIILLLLTASCNKLKQTKRKLSGTWMVLNYRYQNHSGLSYDYNAEGKIQFDNCANESCPYTINFRYVANGVEYEVINSGDYTVLEDAEQYHLNRLNNDGTSTVLENCRIILLTKDELKTQFQDETGIHYFILGK